MSFWCLDLDHMKAVEISPLRSEFPMDRKLENYLSYCDEILGEEGGIFFREAMVHASRSQPLQVGEDQSTQTLAEIEEKFREHLEGRLMKGATQLVFGEGSESAEIVFIGEAPGAEEDRQGRPFVGKAGQLLDKMIQAMGLNRKDVYITNVVKCRPPNNRAPLPEEIDEYMPFLKKQLLSIKPKVVVALGGISAKALLNTQHGITSMRGQFKRLDENFFQDETKDLAAIDMQVMPTFHPAYLLRNPSEKRKVWQDLQKVMEVCELK